MVKMYKFTFKKQKQGIWDNNKVIDIKYRGKEVGYIRQEQDGRCCIYLQVPASDKSLAVNPNFPWSWAKIKTGFSSVEEAKMWLNNNQQNLLSMIYFENDV